YCHWLDLFSNPALTPNHEATVVRGVIRGHSSKGDIVRRLFSTAALLVAFTLSTQAFGQSTYATVNGTIEDATRALLPGVMVTATNNATGVVASALSNESGSYNITGLLPGAYTV